MSDLISRQSLIDALNKFAPEHYTALVNSIIMKEPSVEVRTQMSSADLISRQDAIYLCRERLYETALNNVGVTCKADEVYEDIAKNRIETWLNDLPSAEPEILAYGEGETVFWSEQKWIPCSERLPDYHDEVLVTSHGEVAIAWLYLDGNWRSNDMPEMMYKDIVAWMPLPEPWKGEPE